MIFFALALSWVKELSENTIPGTDYISLFFEVLRKGDKVERTVSFAGFTGRGNRKVQLTSAQYELFHQFAKLRKTHPDDWLEIRPKSLPAKNKRYDIGDYNEVKRLLFSLLDGLFGKGNWTKEQHLTPLKDALFELSKRRERKIRLRVPPSNINL